jgi:hypothetical protein
MQTLPTWEKDAMPNIQDISRDLLASEARNRYVAYMDVFGLAVRYSGSNLLQAIARGFGVSARKWVARPARAVIAAQRRHGR